MLRENTEHVSSNVLTMCLQKTNKKLYLCEGEGVVEDKGQDSTWG